MAWGDQLEYQETHSKFGPIRLLKSISSNYFFQQFICNEEDKKIFIMTVFLFTNAIEL